MIETKQGLWVLTTDSEGENYLQCGDRKYAEAPGFGVGLYTSPHLHDLAILIINHERKSGRIKELTRKLKESTAKKPSLRYVDKGGTVKASVLLGQISSSKIVGNEHLTVFYPLTDEAINALKKRGYVITTAGKKTRHIEGWCHIITWPEHARIKRTWVGMHC